MTGKPLQVEIPKRAPICMEGGETFYPGTEYHSILLETGDNGLQRHDFCSACWEETCRDQWLGLARSHWRASVTIHTKPVEEKIPRNRDADILEFLKSALTNDKSEDQAEAFVLAMYLARKRVLVLREQMTRNGSMVYLYEIASTEEMLAVKRVALSELQTSAIQQRIIAKLG